jgi:MFS family permease
MATPHSIRKTALLSSLGAGLEYYDFIVYGIMAETLSILFFPNDVAWISLIKTFALFAVGYLMRPLGGLLFGAMGDTYGRKQTFLSVMMLMAIATTAIGCLPSYALIGWPAPCLLLALRICQGISLGAELPGAVTVVCENADRQNQGRYSSLIISGASIGSTLATAVLFILSTTLTREQILTWGWRLPFLLGGMLAVASYYIRKHLTETPAFSELQRTRATARLRDAWVSLYQHRRQIPVGIGLIWITSAMVIFALYLPTYLTRQFGHTPGHAYLAMTVGTLWAAIVVPVCGRLADRYGKEQLLAITCGLFIASIFPLFLLLSIPSLWALLPFMIIFQTFVSMLTACYLPILASLFPTSTRYLGTAACYNLTYSIMGCTPMFVTWLIAISGGPNCVIWYLIGCSTVTGLAALSLQRKPVFGLR